VALPTTTDVVASNLKRRGLDFAGTFLSAVLLVMLLTSLAILVTLLVDVFAGGIDVLTDRGWSFVSDPLSPSPEKAGLIQGILGSIALTAIVVVVAFPIGVGAAIYLEEYAKDTRLTRFITANIRNLAGVPSIVYGLLGLAVFVKLAGGLTGGRTVLAGGLTLAVLVLPIMIITASEALRAVPDALRQASMGVGATKWETIRHQVLPVALPAILTGTVLTIARAFGESAPLLLSGAVLSSFFASAEGVSFFERIAQEKYTALPIIVFNWARQPQEEFRALTAAAIIVLLVLLLVVNAAAIILRDRFERA
jgi:phosphate transport system permease protein